MGLEIFQKQKKVEEKKLEVVNNEESRLDGLVVALVEYFEQSIPTQKGLQEVFENYKQYLQSYQITPSLISKVNLALPKNKQVTDYLRYRGVFLSALIQNSYQQGFNNFEFEEVNAHFFGRFLVGKLNTPIVVKAKKINGDCAFDSAENVIAEIQEYSGDIFGWRMKNGKIYSRNPQNLEILRYQILKYQTHCSECVEFVLGKMPKFVKQS